MDDQLLELAAKELKMHMINMYKIEEKWIKG